MFTLLVDIPSWDIRIDVALGTGVRFPRYLYGELMSGMARGASPFASIGVNPSDPLIGPRGEIWNFDLTHFRVDGLHAGDFHLCPMATEAGFLTGEA